MSISYRTGWVLVILLLAVPLLGYLDRTPIRLWDEARLAVNALEMSRNGNWIVTHYDGAPDMWNTKPPLMIWLQAISIKALGPGEIAIRLPAALAAVATCLFLYWFLARKLGLVLAGLLSVVLLVCTEGYLRDHVARTGDYDALLILCTTVYCLSFFHYLETGSRRALAAFFLALTLGALTKGVAAPLFGPGLFLFSLIDGGHRRRLAALFRLPQFWAGVALFLLLVPGYYALREAQNPGYLAAVRENELGGRFLTVIEEHKAGAWMYYDLLVDRYFRQWYLLVPVGLLFGLLASRRELGRLSLLLAMLVVSFLLIISNAATKLDWYAAPLYPFLCVLAALALWTFFEYLHLFAVNTPVLRYPVLPYVLLALLLVQPYTAALQQVTHPAPEAYQPVNEPLAWLLKDVLHGHHRADSLAIVYNDADQNLLWYREALKEGGTRSFYAGKENLQPSWTVAVAQDAARQYIDSAYRTRLVAERGPARLYFIEGLKTP